MERLQRKDHLQEKVLCCNRGTETEINSKGTKGESDNISRTDCLSITDISCDGDAQKEKEIGFWSNIWDQPTYHNQKAAF